MLGLELIEEFLAVVEVGFLQPLGLVVVEVFDEVESRVLIADRVWCLGWFRFPIPLHLQ